jgi:aconitate hydratase
VSGLAVNQVVLGSSANPGLRDFWIVSEIIKGNDFPFLLMSIHLPPSIRKPNGNGSFRPLIAAGGRLHQSGCMGCIGMGQAPATNTISLRTMPRNFPGRSGTLDDKIYL